MTATPDPRRDDMTAMSCESHGQCFCGVDVHCGGTVDCTGPEDHRKDPRIEAVAKLLFTGPIFQFNTSDWDDGTSYAMARRQCLMAAEDVLRGIEEAATKDTHAKNRAWIDKELSVEEYYRRYVRGQKAPE